MCQTRFPLKWAPLQGPVWLPELHKLFFVSNRLGNRETTDQHVQMWTLDPESMETQEVVPSTPILMANGATNWAPTKVLVEQQVGPALAMKACMLRVPCSLMAQLATPRP